MPSTKWATASSFSTSNHGTAAQVAEGLEELHRQMRADELMLVVGGHVRRAQARTVELIANHYGMPSH